MHYRTYIILIISFFAMLSCDRDEYFDIATSYNTEPLMIKGTYKGPDETNFVDFQIDIGTPDTTIFEEYFYWNADVSEGELGPTMIVGAYTSKPTFDAVIYFGMQFWSDQLPSNRQWNHEELEAFFAPGNTFELGRGAGLVDISFRYPGVYDFGSLDDISSKSSFLENPQGQLQVTALEAFQFDGIQLTETRGAVYDGFLVSCVVNAEVGLNRDKRNLAYDVEDLMTDEIIELREVELTFFVGT